MTPGEGKTELTTWDQCARVVCARRRRMDQGQGQWQSLYDVGDGILALPLGIEQSSVLFWHNEVEAVVSYSFPGQRRESELACTDGFRIRDGYVRQITGAIIASIQSKDGKTWYTCYVDAVNGRLVILATSDGDDDFNYLLEQTREPHQDFVAYNGLLYHRIRNMMIPLMVDLEDPEEIKQDSESFSALVFRAKNVGCRSEWALGPFKEFVSQGSAKENLQQFMGSDCTSWVVGDMSKHVTTSAANCTAGDVVFAGVSESGGGFGMWKWPLDKARKMLRRLRWVGESSADEHVHDLSIENMHPCDNILDGFPLLDEVDFEDDSDDFDDDEEDDEDIDDDDDGGWVFLPV